MSTKKNEDYILPSLESKTIPMSSTEKYAAALTDKMALLTDIEEKDEKLLKAMIMVEKETFAESIKNTIGHNLLGIAKIVKTINLANDCHIETDKVMELINDEIEAIIAKISEYFMENIPLTKRKTDAQDMRNLMNELDISKVLNQKENNEVNSCEKKEKWFHKIIRKIKSLF